MGAAVVTVVADDEGFGVRWGFLGCFCLINLLILFVELITILELNCINGRTYSPHISFVGQDLICSTLLWI
jgi:hypothetical protein